MIKKIIVHGGTFHADDVMSVALMKTINPDIGVERVFKVEYEDAEDVIIADIDGGKYDHHQEDARLREDGEKFAACGLIFEDFWKEICPKEEFYKAFKGKYIIPIEDADNGVSHNPLSQYIHSFNPEWDDETNPDDAFLKAVDVFMDIIAKEVAHQKAKDRAVEIINSAKTDGEILILPCYVPWQGLVPEEVNFVVFPSNRGGFNAQVVPVNPNSFEPKKPFPETLTTESKGCNFVHPARFIAGFETEEDAISALKVGQKKKIYILHESVYGGGNSVVYTERAEAEVALLTNYEDAKTLARMPIEDCYWNHSCALVKTDDIDDYWYGVIIEQEV